MLGAAVVLFRFLQFSGATILFGSSLCLIYALPRQGSGSGSERRWSRHLLGWGAVTVLAGSLLGLVAQTAVLAGSLSEGLRPSSLGAVITTTSLGPSALVRATAAALALTLVRSRPAGLGLFAGCAALGAVVTASFAWMGHGAASEGLAGLLHTAADILHALAAAVWIGALVVFLGLLRSARADATADRILHDALHGFSGIGSALVAVLVATGLVNSWFLVGPDHIRDLLNSTYGILLVLKIAAFTVMLALAASNRVRLTPDLRRALDGGSTEVAIAALRRSVAIEAAAGGLVLALVAVLGTLAPPSAGV